MNSDFFRLQKDLGLCITVLLYIFLLRKESSFYLFFTLGTQKSVRRQQLNPEKENSHSRNTERNQACWLNCPTDFSRKWLFFLKWKLSWPRSELMFTFSDYANNTEDTIPFLWKIELTSLKITCCETFISGM